MTWLLITGGVVGLIFLLTVLFGAPYVPSRKRDLAVGFDELYAVGSGDTLVDIGSGDGVVLRAAATRGAEAIGFEINPILVLVSRLLSRRYQNVAVKQANYMRSDLPENTTIVYLFGEDYHIKKINAWLDRQANRRGRSFYVMSYGFMLPGRRPVRELRAHRLYLVEPLQPAEAQV